ncbi:MAG: RDD family protein [Bacteroidales bacterium]|nr:RDD family protein [Bacteroidales bacterium]
METLTEENKKEFRYAGFWLRFVAYLIDYFILQFAGFILSLPFIGGIILSAIKLENNPLNEGLTFLGVAGIFGFVLLIVLINLLLGWLYFAFMQSSRAQATLGKMALNLIVTDLEGNRITFGRATARYFSKIISNMTLYIGYVLAGLTEKKQALHDMIAGTLVMKK